MMKDQFANYVVQKVLETCDEKDRELILSRIKVHLNALKKYTYGKHIVARIEKLVAAGGIWCWLCNFLISSFTTIWFLWKTEKKNIWSTSFSFRKAHWSVFMFFIRNCSQNGMIRHLVQLTRVSHQLLLKINNELIFSRFDVNKFLACEITKFFHVPMYVTSMSYSFW